MREFKNSGFVKLGKQVNDNLIPRKRASSLSKFAARRYTTPVKDMRAWCAILCYAFVRFVFRGLVFQAEAHRRTERRRFWKSESSCLELQVVSLFLFLLAFPPTLSFSPNSRGIMIVRVVRARARVKICRLKNIKHDGHTIGLTGGDDRRNCRLTMSAFNARWETIPNAKFLLD